MVTILREADRSTVAGAAKKHKVSEPTIYAWRKHFGQMEAPDVKRLKTLEQENTRLKKLLAEAALDIEVLPSQPRPFYRNDWVEEAEQVTCAWWPSPG